MRLRFFFSFNNFLLLASKETDFVEKFGIGIVPPAWA